MTTHRVRSGDGWVELPVAGLAGEGLVVPNVAGVVRRPDGAVLLQRRDKPGEDVRGRHELPAGKWRAGETAVQAVEREVFEETGIRVVVEAAVADRVEAMEGRPFETVTPIATVIGVEGAYPALVLAFACSGDGEPRAQAGETADPEWLAPEEIRRLLEAPERFTGPAAAILRAVLG
ncbi:MAG: NUDIX hydrolase [Acidimicrobiia bacterium]|nr:NUDIX hydrolase [Acidimicrobiia bacterium]